MKLDPKDFPLDADVLVPFMARLLQRVRERLGSHVRLDDITVSIDVELPNASMWVHRLLREQDQ